MENKILCGIYMRVSTEDQAREGFSLEKQVHDIKKSILENISFKFSNFFIASLSVPIPA